MRPQQTATTAGMYARAFLALTLAPVVHVAARNLDWLRSMILGSHTADASADNDRALTRYESDSNVVALAAAQHGDHTSAFSLFSSGGFTPDELPTIHDSFAVTTGSGNQESDVVALDANNFIAVWQNTTAPAGIYGRRFSYNNVTSQTLSVGNIFPIVTTPFTQWPVALAPFQDTLGNKRFAAGWSKFAGAGWNTFVSLYSYDSGTPVAIGSVFQGNAVSSGSHDSLRIVGVPGGIVVVHSDYNGHDGDGYGIFATPFSITGTTVTAGTEIQANVISAGNQWQPAAAYLGNNIVAIAWSSLNLQTGQETAYFRTFKLTGSGLVPITSNDIPANSASTQNQRYLALAGSAATNAVAVTFDQFGGTNWDVFGGLFNMSGYPLQSVVQLNPGSLVQQSRTAVVAVPGGYVLSWESGTSTISLLGQVRNASSWVQEGPNFSNVSTGITGRSENQAALTQLTDGSVVVTSTSSASGVSNVVARVIQPPVVLTSSGNVPGQSSSSTASGMPSSSSGSGSSGSSSTPSSAAMSSTGSISVSASPSASATPSGMSSSSSGSGSSGSSTPSSGASSSAANSNSGARSSSSAASIAISSTGGVASSTAAPSTAGRSSSSGFSMSSGMSSSSNDGSSGSSPSSASSSATASSTGTGTGGGLPPDVVSAEGSSNAMAVNTSVGVIVPAVTLIGGGLFLRNYAIERSWKRDNKIEVRIADEIRRRLGLKLGGTRSEKGTAFAEDIRTLLDKLESQGGINLREMFRRANSGVQESVSIPQTGSSSLGTSSERGVQESVSIPQAGASPETSSARGVQELLDAAALKARVEHYIKAIVNALGGFLGVPQWGQSRGRTWLKRDFYRAGVIAQNLAAVVSQVLSQPLPAPMKGMRVGGASTGTGNDVEFEASQVELSQLGSDGSRTTAAMGLETFSPIRAMGARSRLHEMASSSQLLDGGDSAEEDRDALTVVSDAYGAQLLIGAGATNRGDDMAAVALSPLPEVLSRKDGSSAVGSSRSSSPVSVADAKYAVEPADETRRESDMPPPLPPTEEPVGGQSRGSHSSSLSAADAQLVRRDDVEDSINPGGVVARVQSDHRSPRLFVAAQSAVVGGDEREVSMGPGTGDADAPRSGSRSPSIFADAQLVAAEDGDVGANDGDLDVVASRSRRSSDSPAPGAAVS